MQLDQDDLEKLAGGDILARLAQLAARPFVGAERGQAINRAVQAGITKGINQPLESAMRKARLHKAISKFYEVGMTPIPGTPRLFHPVMPDVAQRRAYGNWKGDDIVHTLAQHPDAAVVGGLGTAIAPAVPGITESYIAGKHLIGKALGNKTKLAEMVPSFTDELLKIANGDMLQYFQDHPEKLKEKQERDRRKKEKTAECGCDHDPLEEAYWKFDALHHGHEAGRKKAGLGPMEERMAFKSAVAPLLKQAWQDRISGGLADKKKPSQFKQRQLKKGRKTELEHVNDRNIATEIAMDHLVEDPNYYDKLEVMEKMAQVMPYQQATQWTCSAACLKAVLGHYGHEVPEELAVQAVGARPNRGAECNEIMWAAHKFGFDAFEFSFESLEQAKWLLDQDIPIIADIQSFNHPGKGHYVVITGIDDQGVHLMDPNTPGNQRTISHEEMEERWWDRAMAPPHELMPKWGIVILPPEGP